MFQSPFGPRQITYCDYTATGRSLNFIETYIADMVLPLYANTHSANAVAAKQMTYFVAEARELVLKAFNGNPEKDVALFAGSGSTGAINLLVGVLGLRRNRGDSNGQPEHVRPIVFVSLLEHHSNLLPWRDSIAEVVQIAANEDGTLDRADLTAKLSLYSSRPLRIGAFCASSNVTGLRENTTEITELLHAYGALAMWDCSALVPHAAVDMNAISHGHDAHFDAMVFSPHKLLGGVGSPGVLIAKKALFDLSASSSPGGGTVFYVSDHGHSYVEETEFREEGGTPNIVGIIRAGLAVQLHRNVGPAFIEAREHELVRRALDDLVGNASIQVLGSKRATRCAVLSLMFQPGELGGLYLHHNFAMALLNDLFGIQARGGCACAAPYAQWLLGISRADVDAFDAALHQADENELLRPGFLRISLSYTMSDADLDFVLSALHFVASHGWQLLPLYRVVPISGQWIHLESARATQRRWLAAISYAEGHMSYERPHLNAGPTFSYLARALDLLSSATESRSQAATAAAARSKAPSSTTRFVTAGNERLVWFALPADAATVLHGPGLAPRTTPLPLAVRDVDRERNVEAVAAPLLHGRAALTDDEREARLKSVLAMNMAMSSLTVDNDEDESQPDARASEAQASCEEAVASAGEARPSPLADQFALLRVPPKSLMRVIGRAVHDFSMIQEGDRVLVGVSGGKDSLTLLHALLAMQRKSPVKFHIGAVTVDPQTEAFNPAPLIPYMRQLGVPYFFESEAIIKLAQANDAKSICSFCSRIKRGKIYTCMRREGYNVLAFGQHLDDFAESFLMSAFFNGLLRTMKANYYTEGGDLRVIRPLVYCRESALKDFAYSAGLPVISENCPGCFDAPEERYRIKQLLAAQELIHPNLFGSLKGAMMPLISQTNTEEDVFVSARQRAARPNAVSAPVIAHMTASVAATSNSS